MHLQAGEWALEFRDGDLWHIRTAGVEAVERIYFALRDENWGTAPFRMEGLQHDAGPEGFRISFRALHDSGGIRFRWQAEIEGRAEGTLRYTAAGEALSAFRKNRIGLCIHHPLSCSGRTIRVTHSSGSVSSAAFPRLISPHQPVMEIRSMQYAVGHGREIRIDFSGDIWEMEDQRNWSDANFKTYPTPLSLPFPVEIQPGARVEQTVEIRLLHAGARRPLPTGLVLDAIPPEPRNVERLHRLKIAHLRLEDPARLAEAARWNLPVELALEADDEPDRQLAALDAAAAPLARVIVYRRDEPVPAPRWIERVRMRFPNVPVLPGANGHFAELNRNRSSDFSQGAAFGLYPQVHAFDDESIMANLASHESMIETFRSFAGGAPVFLSPVRFAPPGIDDPRLPTAFGAAWTRGALANFSRLGVAAATLHSVKTVLDAPPLEAVFAGGGPQ